MPALIHDKGGNDVTQSPCTPTHPAGTTTPLHTLTAKQLDSQQQQLRQQKLRLSLIAT